MKKRRIEEPNRNLTRVAVTVPPKPSAWSSQVGRHVSARMVYAISSTMAVFAHQLFQEQREDEPADAAQLRG
jgi:hypothetical protein